MFKVTIPRKYSTDDWVRMPKPDERFMGLSRATPHQILTDPTTGVRSAVIKKPGARRGIRLIYLPSLLDYLARLAKLEEPEGAAK
jgi:hypothetical protein